jgi:hypothetical protein
MTAHRDIVSPDEFQATRVIQVSVAHNDRLDILDTIARGLQQHIHAVFIPALIISSPMAHGQAGSVTLDPVRARNENSGEKDENFSHFDKTTLLDYRR